MTRARSIAFVAVPLIAALTGCGGGTRACKVETLFVTVTFGGSTSAADQVTVDVTVDGVTTTSIRDHEANASVATIEIDFPHGYPVGKQVDVRIVALENRAPLGSNTGSVPSLPAGCTALTIALAGESTGTGGMGGTGGGAAGTGGSTAGRGGTGGSTAGRGGTTGVAGSRGGTGGGTAGRGGTTGSGGTGGMPPTIPPCRLAMFATANEGFVLNPYNPDLGNLVNREAGALPTLAWTAAEGIPSAGALRVDAPFTDFNQLVDVQKALPNMAVQNLAAATKLHVAVKIASGLNPNPSDPPGVQVYADSYDGTYHFKGNYTVVPAGNGWHDYVLDLAPGNGFDPAKVTNFGVLIQTGAGLPGGNPDPQKPTAAVAFVDSFWLEGACDPRAGATGPTCAAGVSNPPPKAAITDFSDAVADPAHAGEFRFGSPNSLYGGTGRFASGTLGTLALTGGSLMFSGAIETPTASNMYPYNGYALYFDGPACVNASAYDGVSFTVSGLTGNCQVVFGIDDAEHGNLNLDLDRGLCSGSCFGPKYEINTSTVRVAFADAPTISPNPISALNRGKLTGLGFQFNKSPTGSGACTGTLTVDNIAFYSNATTFGQPSCPSNVAKGAACAAADIQLCYKTCGPENVGAKSETCQGGTYAEMSGCSFEATRNYACYKIPGTANTACPAGVTPQASMPCTVNQCVLCNSTAGLPGGHYNDSGGADKMGYCVCPAANAQGIRNWSCATDTAWPCPAGQGC